MYCARWGAQSSGSTTSPVLLRLMMFIATITGWMVCELMFVTVVSNVVVSPVFTDALSLVMEICKSLASDWAGGSAGTEVTFKESMRQAITDSPTLRVNFDQSWLHRLSSTVNLGLR